MSDDDYEADWEGRYYAPRPTHHLAAQAQQPPLHQLVDQLERALQERIPHIGFRDNGTAGWHADTYIELLGQDGYDRLILAGHLQPCRSDTHYFRYSYTPWAREGQR